MTASVLILTLNEEQNLPNCLASLGWCDDIVVLDSFSTDKTIEIAEAAGARVIQRRFDNYAAQRNYGLNEIKFNYPWVLMLDADEVCTDEFSREITHKVKQNDTGTCLYRFRRKDFFMGRWLRRSGGYPSWLGRLVKVGHVTVEREINEEYHTDGWVGFLNAHIHHYPFNKGFAAWFEKHNRYSNMEAAFICQGKNTIIWRNLFSKDPSVRRQFLKALVYKMPGRPLIMFMLLYGVRGGFLDGRAGFTYCLLRSFYEFMISCKIKEIRLRKTNSPL